MIELSLNEIVLEVLTRGDEKVKLFCLLLFNEFNELSTLFLIA